MKSLWYVDADDAVETGEINMFVGDDFIITVRHGEGSELHTARRDLEARAKVLTHGPSAVVYAVCDRVVDGYLSVMDSLEEDVDEVETSVFSDQRTNDSARIYTLKREIAEARRAVMPLREPMRRFATGAVPGIHEDAAPFFRDVLDHLTKVAETVDGLDQLLSTAFDAHLAQISVIQNEDMRKISAGVGLVVVPTLIAGVYGMNFDHMPELAWALGYPFAIGLMLVSVPRSGSSSSAPAGSEGPAVPAALVTRGGGVEPLRFGPKPQVSGRCRRLVPNRTLRGRGQVADITFVDTRGPADARAAAAARGRESGRGDHVRRQQHDQQERPGRRGRG